jgi:hypothetical protein
MYDRERRSVHSQGEFLLEDLDYLDPFGAEMANQLKARLRKIKDLRPKAKLLNVKQVASGSVIKPGKCDAGWHGVSPLLRDRCRTLTLALAGPVTGRAAPILAPIVNRRRKR